MKQQYFNIRTLSGNARQARGYAFNIAGLVILFDRRAEYGRRAAWYATEAQSGCCLFRADDGRPRLCDAIAAAEHKLPGMIEAIKASRFYKDDINPGLTADYTVWKASGQIIRKEG